MCVEKTDTALPERVQRNAMQRNAMQRDAWQRDALRCDATRTSGSRVVRVRALKGPGIEKRAALLDKPGRTAGEPTSLMATDAFSDDSKPDDAFSDDGKPDDGKHGCSQRTGFFYLGELIEYGATSELFTNPKKERTKDYITGRYG